MTETPQELTRNPIKYVRRLGDTLEIRFKVGHVTMLPSIGGVWIPRTGGTASVDPEPTPDPGVDPVDDYPYKTYPIGEASPWLFYYRECVDFCCWRVRRRTARTDFYNYYKGVRWGNANNWDNAALQTGVRVDTTPAVGSVAVRNAGTYGHVAYVYAVNADGTYNIEEYNWNFTHNYSVRDNLTVAGGGFDKFIHFEDSTP